MISKLTKLKYSILFIWMCGLFAIANAQESERPKIGLTLSGGGAKGLAHIGVLKAIDAAGLKIDYITGTSMGAVVGSLYAAGYTGVQIDSIARTIEWEVLLSNQIPLRMLFMEEKEQYNRFLVELPLVNGKIKLRRGIIRGPELDLKLSEVFAPFYDITSFNDLHIPFQCMATDLETGNLVVLDSGNLPTAIRASMAIPTVFTDVNIDGMRLVDGGLVSNFPVKSVIEMGADYVIGSNVTAGLTKEDKINNALDVIVQMAFFKSKAALKNEIPLVDTYIFIPFEKYGTGSFGNSNEIMQIGNETGEKFYPEFKHLADSLIQIYGNQSEREVFKVVRPSIFINETTIDGLENTTESFFMHLMKFKNNRSYTPIQISNAIRRAYGSMYYKSITYELKRNQTGTEIIFNVEENAQTYLKAGLFYDKFRGINVNLNITTRDFLTPNSRSMVSGSIGESAQLEAQHFQYLGRNKSFALVPSFDLERLYINSYDKDYEQDGAYRQLFYTTGLDFQTSAHQSFAVGLGTAYEWIHFKPAIRSEIEVKGNFSKLKSYFFAKFNTLNQTFYPTRGFRLYTELGYVYDQKPNITLFANGEPTGDVDIVFDNYTRLYIDGTAHVPLSGNFNLFSEFQSGVNLTDQLNVLNDFYIGGINGEFRNQIRFAGLNEVSINSPSAAMLQFGLRYRMFNNIYIIGRANGLVRDFVSVNNNPAKTAFLTGYALTFAYKSPIGPFELSAMYSPESNSVQSYVRFGIVF